MTAAILVTLIIFGTLAVGIAYAVEDFGKLCAIYKIGAGENRNEDSLPGLLPSAGLSATLTTESAAGADAPYDWNTAA